MANFNNYKCTVCGYTYREEKGEMRCDVEPGTYFEDLPESFRCPTCNQSKMAFELRKV